ncbi:CAMK/CAMKL/CHK1 protein kinase [Trametes gibbosa]|nr:CAMK/CAMKL/CHK1 protein kinase [Trametes gibbosa]
MTLRRVLRHTRRAFPFFSSLARSPPMEEQARLKLPSVAGYKLVKQIGGGGFSVVYQAVNLVQGRVAACKVIAITPESNEAQLRAIEKEIRVHSALKHKHILELIGAAKLLPDRAALSGHFPAMYLLMEMAAGGDLFDKIAPDQGIGPDVAHFYFCQMLNGLQYIHSEGVCHRDLKPENLLLDGSGTLKISDFGLSAVYKLKDTGKTRMLNERCGSLPYLAPEMRGDQPYAAEPIDVWGSGVILFTMLAGNTPWDEPTRGSPEFVQYLTGESFNFEPWIHFHEDLLSLITGMLDVDPAHRMTLVEVASHPWVTRPSQIAGRGPRAIAQSLTAGLRANGDLSIAEPQIGGGSDDSMNTDEDGDYIMHNARSQFTQSLMLFSQTQRGSRYRYAPSLTRFFAALAPHVLLPLLQEALTALGAKHNPPREAVRDDSDGCSPTATTTSTTGAAAAAASGVPMIRMRVGAKDRRKLHMKGYVEIEPFQIGEYAGSFVVFARDVGNPLEWRAMWKALVRHPLIDPHVYRKPR